jgi:hypothetical protein
MMLKFELWWTATFFFESKAKEIVIALWTGQSQLAVKYLEPIFFIVLIKIN